MEKLLNGKIALITGASSGIGLATAKLFCENGAIVIFVARSKDKANASLNSLGNIVTKNSSCFICNIENENQVKQLYNFVKETYGKIDILFNNAGVYPSKELLDMSVNDWNEAFSINSKGTFLITKSLIPLLLEAKKSGNNNANIIFNASIAGMQSFIRGKNSYAYASSKASVIEFAKLIAKNYAMSFRTNVICPGIIDTPIFTNSDLSRYNSSIPMGRVGEADDVAKLCLFLASDNASYINGATITIDGGLSL